MEYRIRSLASGPRRRERACTWSGPTASSFKRQAQRASSFKRQASSPKQQASSLNPQATSSWIMVPGKSFTVPGPRASTKINELLGWRTWNAIWCGENLILFPLHTFNSIVKKCPLLLQTSRSGVPCKLLFSSRISENFLNFLLIFS